MRLFYRRNSGLYERIVISTGGRSLSCGMEKPAVCYLAECSPGALLEVLVHLELDASALPRSYTQLHVSVPSGVAIAELTNAGETWSGDMEASRDLVTTGFGRDRQH